MLIGMFGQSESQTLLRVDVQRDALDDYGCSEATREAVIAAAQSCAEAGRALDRLRAAGSRDPAQLEFLQFQKTGRASCRESVSEDGLISVVDVSLKKKHEDIQLTKTRTTN